MDEFLYAFSDRKKKIKQFLREWHTALVERAFVGWLRLHYSGPTSFFKELNIITKFCTNIFTRRNMTNAFKRNWLFGIIAYKKTGSTAEVNRNFMFNIICLHLLIPVPKYDNKEPADNTNIFKLSTDELMQY